MRNQATDAALERSISRERLRKYLEINGNNLALALDLYEYNMRLSEAFYSPLQSLEICLRNNIHARMSERYGADWLSSNAAAPLTDHARSFINDAMEGVQGEVTPGKVVAELKFAFWVGLLGPRYDATIWRQAIYRCFLANGGLGRSAVHGRFNAIRRFRNRIAHHEPIFHRPIQQMHSEILEAIGWMCPHTRNWTAHHSRVPRVLRGSGRSRRNGMGTL